MPHVVTRGMSEGMDERPTFPLSSRIAARPQQRLFNDEVAFGIPLHLPHQYVSFCDLLCHTVELPKFGFNVSEDLIRRPRWLFRSAARPEQ